MSSSSLRVNCRLLPRARRVRNRSAVEDECHHASGQLRATSTPSATTACVDLDCDVLTAVQFVRHRCPRAGADIRGPQFIPGFGVLGVDASAAGPKHEVAGRRHRSAVSALTVDTPDLTVGDRISGDDHRAAIQFRLRRPVLAAPADSGVKCSLLVFELGVHGIEHAAAPRREIDQSGIGVV